MKLFLAVMLLGAFSFAKEKDTKREPQQVSVNVGLTANSKVCLTKARDIARADIKAEAGPDNGDLLNDKPRTVKLKNGMIYVFSAYVNKVFDWEVIVTVDRECNVKYSNINDL